jgi:hypothetical protein
MRSLPSKAPSGTCGTACCTRRRKRPGATPSAMARRNYWTLCAR